jgi:DNA-binding NarL/FixJ family response regulator
MHHPRHRIFLVDDHPLVRESLAGLIAAESDLEVSGHAGDAESAMVALRAARPEVAVVDLSLPGGSGLDLLKTLQAELPEVRLLVLSMHEEAGTAERALQAGASGYIVKRESGSKVVEAIREIVAGRCYVSPALLVAMTNRLQSRGAPDTRSLEKVLSARELEVFQLRGQGLRGFEIAEKMGVSAKTVGSYETRIKEKLGLDGANELLREAILWVEQKKSV